MTVRVEYPNVFKKALTAIRILNSLSKSQHNKFIFQTILNLTHETLLTVVREIQSNYQLCSVLTLNRSHIPALYCATRQQPDLLVILSPILRKTGMRGFPFYKINFTACANNLAFVPVWSKNTSRMLIERITN